VRAAIFNGEMDITVSDRPDPVLQEPSDAVVRSSWDAFAGPTSGITAASLRTRSARSGTSSSGWWSRRVPTCKT